MSIILNNVSFTYGEGTAYEMQALKNVTLKIDDGEFIGIIGHTGSGKSTLIQHLNGLMKAVSGEIYFNGRDIYEEDFDLRELRTRVGLVFQYPEHQLFETTVFNDVCFGPMNQGFDKNEAGLRAFEALRMAGVPEKLYYQPPFDLSGGQKRRVAIAGVLAMKPEVLILDEPTAGLDPKGRDKILSQIKRYHESSGKTILLVSHSMEDIVKYASKVLVMNKGRLFCYDDTDKVFERTEELAKIGLDVPQVTRMSHILKELGVDIGSDIYTTERAAERLLALIKGDNENR